MVVACQLSLSGITISIAIAPGVGKDVFVPKPVVYSRHLLVRLSVSGFTALTSPPCPHLYIYDTTLKHTGGWTVQFCQQVGGSTAAEMSPKQQYAEVVNH